MAKSGDQQVQTEQKQQQSTTQPWAEAQPMLRKLIDQYSGLNVGVTDDQSTALTKLNAAVTGLPDFSSQGMAGVNNVFDTTTAPQVGMLSSALDQLKSNIGGVASGAELDPYKTPGFSDAISTMTDDITNKVKGVYAASGRAPSGAGSFAGSLGRGLTQGISPVIAEQFNKNNTNRLNAANTLFGAGGKTATDITGQKQVDVANTGQGINLVGMLQKMLTDPAQMQLNAANTTQNLPFQNLQALLNPATQIAGLGGQTAGTSSGKSTTEAIPSTMSNVMGGVSGAIGLLSFLSDERAKEEIEPVGKLFDGQTIHRYRYKGDPRMQIGLLAQEVDEIEPDAVDELPQIGLLAVNYRKATDRAAQMRRAA